MTRSSASITTFTAAGLLLAVGAPGAHAYSCGFDPDGNYGCSSFATGTLVAMVVSVVVPIILIGILISLCVRRRRSRSVLDYAQQSEPMKQAAVGSYPIGGQGCYQQTATQYGNVQPPMEGHALPMSPPPAANTQQYYAPPAGLTPSVPAVNSQRSQAEGHIV